jgi:hypothetical protein
VIHEISGQKLMPGTTISPEGTNSRIETISHRVLL